MSLNLRKEKRGISMAKWDNMLSMLWMLRSGRKLTAAQIADSLEISVRTVYRYIDALCASGVPVIAESGHDGGIRIMDSLWTHLNLLKAQAIRIRRSYKMH